MTMLASQITSLMVVYSIVYSGVNQRKHQSSASLAFVREIHRGPVNFPHKWPVTRKMLPFDDVIMSILAISRDISLRRSNNYKMISMIPSNKQIYEYNSEKNIDLSNQIFRVWVGAEVACGGRIFYFFEYAKIYIYTTKIFLSSVAFIPLSPWNKFETKRTHSSDQFYAYKWNSGTVHANNRKLFCSAKSQTCGQCLEENIYLWTYGIFFQVCSNMSGIMIASECDQLLLQKNRYSCVIRSNCKYYRQVKPLI